MNNKILGLVLLVVGVALAYWGYNMSQSVSEQFRETVTGSFSDKATWLMIGGGVLSVLGVAQVLFKK